VTRRPLALAVALAALLAGCGGPATSDRATGERAAAASPPSPAPLPRPGAPLPREPAALADALTATTRSLRSEIERWSTEGDPASGPPPEAVTLLALHQQRIYRLIAPRRRLGDRVLSLLPASVAGEARDTVRARRALIAIPPSGNRRPRISTGEPKPAGALRAHYREAQRRFGVGWHVLAAVNLVETGFNKLRNNSVAGAQGPMQFIPSTWRAYGMGGDIRDPRDAIMGAANYLHSSGAPGNYRRALYAYNPSTLYVRGVLNHARRIAHDPNAFYSYYAWSIFVRTPRGENRLTGPTADAER
jgi:soluble lytic murein transglycosylase-like protein